MDTGLLHDLTVWLSSTNHIISDKSFPIPLAQSLLILMMTTICMILGRIKVGFFIAYGFIFYWGFIGNRLFFLDLFGGSAVGMLFYVFTGLVMSIVMFFGFFQETH